VRNGFEFIDSVVGDSIFLSATSLQEQEFWLKEIGPRIKVGGSSYFSPQGLPKEKNPPEVGYSKR
jgi:hypothetical protein